jgi:hypothetical protein
MMPPSRSLRWNKCNGIQRCEESRQKSRCAKSKKDVEEEKA